VSPSIFGFAVWQWKLAGAIAFFISVAGILEGYRKQAGRNPIIMAALDAEQDTTGLCTVRELVSYLLELPKPIAELAFELGGKRINVQVEVLAVDGMPPTATPHLPAELPPSSAPPADQPH
jgi:hypothetical protein